ncbi:hypothetical protein AB0I81_33660 [Nonomuraea sp. NPDC050404]|uniref:hypothetical protein n=1 Tax=Nonomuraea sp. NPDC050404 TaxID=3155783 RepID=UPI0033FB5BC6
MEYRDATTETLFSARPYFAERVDHQGAAAAFSALGSAGFLPVIEVPGLFTS